MSIKAIWGAEPMREGESPDYFEVGRARNPFPTVTRIERRDEFFGDHSIGWFDIFSGENLAASMNVRHVATVLYADEDHP